MENSEIFLKKNYLENKSGKYDKIYLTYSKFNITKKITNIRATWRCICKQIFPLNLTLYSNLAVILKIACFKGLLHSHEFSMLTLEHRKRNFKERNYFVSCSL